MGAGQPKKARREDRLAHIVFQMTDDPYLEDLTCTFSDFNKLKPFKKAMGQAQRLNGENNLTNQSEPNFTVYTPAYYPVKEDTGIINLENCKVTNLEEKISDKKPKLIVPI